MATSSESAPACDLISDPEEFRKRIMESEAMKLTLEIQERLKSQPEVYERYINFYTDFSKEIGSDPAKAPSKEELAARLQAHAQEFLEKDHPDLYERQMAIINKKKEAAADGSGVCQFQQT